MAAPPPADPAMIGINGTVLVTLVLVVVTLVLVGVTPVTLVLVGVTPVTLVTLVLVGVALVTLVLVGVAMTSEAGGRVTHTLGPFTPSCMRSADPIARGRGEVMSSLLSPLI